MFFSTFFLPIRTHSHPPPISSSPYHHTVSIFDVFEIPPVFSLPNSTRYSKQQQILLTESSPLAFEPHCHSLRPKDRVSPVVYNLHGFRQSFKYFNHGPTAADLRRTLRFKNITLVRNAQEWLAKVNASATRGDTLNSASRGRSIGSEGKTGSRRQVVGVHVRYGMAKGGSFGGCLPPPQYYLKAMNFYR
jgi:hypothetical protein